MQNERQRNGGSKKCLCFGILTRVRLDLFATVPLPLPLAIAYTDMYTFSHTHTYTHSCKLHLHASASFSCSAGGRQTERTTISLLCCSITQDISPDAELSWPSGLKEGNGKEQQVEQ